MRVKQFCAALLLLLMSVVGVSAQSNTVTVKMAYQPFQNGFMLWNSNNGTVTVYIGKEAGNFQLFPSVLYGWRPNDPVKEAAPAGLHKPILGLGKVWGYFPEVRKVLGWATAPEQSYTATMTMPTVGHIRTTLPGDRYVQTSSNSGWVVGNDMTPTTSQIYAAFQPFDNGYMVWREDTGSIYVLFNDSSFTTAWLSGYRNLPDNPVSAPPPNGKVAPVSGFGRVWGNFSEIQQRIGWGLAAEQGYLSTLETISDTHIKLTLPDGRKIYLHGDGWNFE